MTKIGSSDSTVTNRAPSGLSNPHGSVSQPDDSGMSILSPVWPDTVKVAFGLSGCAFTWIRSPRKGTSQVSARAGCIDAATMAANRKAAAAKAVRIARRGGRGGHGRAPVRFSRQPVNTRRRAPRSRCPCGLLYANLPSMRGRTNGAAAVPGRPAPAAGAWSKQSEHSKADDEHESRDQADCPTDGSEFVA